MLGLFCFVGDHPCRAKLQPMGNGFVFQISRFGVVVACLADDGEPSCRAS